MLQRCPVNFRRNTVILFDHDKNTIWNHVIIFPWTFKVMKLCIFKPHVCPKDGKAVWKPMSYFMFRFCLPVFDVVWSWALQEHHPYESDNRPDQGAVAPHSTDTRLQTASSYCYLNYSWMSLGTCSWFPFDLYPMEPQMSSLQQQYTSVKPTQSPGKCHNFATSLPFTNLSIRGKHYTYIYMHSKNQQGTKKILTPCPNNLCTTFFIYTSKMQVAMVLTTALVQWTSDIHLF